MGTRYQFLHADARGSIMAASDSAGNSLAAYRYGPYGEPDSWSAGALASRFRYTGQLMIPELQVYHYKARAYAPKLGRFLQSDPIGYTGGMNLYAYAGNDPVNRSDPSGLLPCNGCKPIDSSPDSPPIVISGVRDSCGGRSFCNSGSSLEVFGESPFADNSWNPDGTIDVVVVSGTKAKPQKEKPTLEKLKDCAAAQYGFGDGETPTGIDLAKIGSEIGSLPVFKPLVGIPVIGDSSRFTNVLNYASLRLGLNARFEGAGLRNFTKSTFGSVRIATVLGRANVVVGGALLAVDAASIAICTARD